MKKNTKLFMIVFLGIMTAIAPIATDMYVPALPLLGPYFDVNTSMIQLTLTIIMLGMALGQVIGGPISDKMGRKVPLLIGLIFFSAASLACVVSKTIYSFLFFRFLQGLSGAFGLVISRAIARDYCKGETLVQFYGLLMMVNGLAPVLSPIVGAQILRFMDWKGVFIALSMVGILMIIATIQYRETLPIHQRVSDFSVAIKNFKVLVKDSYFLGHCLIQSFIYGGFFTYIGGTSFLFQELYQVSSQAFSFIFGSIGIGLLLSGMIPAKLARTVKGVNMLAYALGVHLMGALLFLVGVLLHASMWWSVLSLSIAVIPLSVMGATSTSMALTKRNNNIGGASALLGFSAMALGGILMPFAGIAGSKNALPMAILMCLAFLLGNLVFYKYVKPCHISE